MPKIARLSGGRNAIRFDFVDRVFTPKTAMEVRNPAPPKSIIKKKYYNYF